MRIIAIALFVCCLGVVLDVGEAKAESSTDGGFDANEKEQQFLLIIKELEEQVAKEREEFRTTKEEFRTTNEEFRTTIEELRTTNKELREEIHRQRENKDSKTIKKLQSQLKEYKSRGAATKRLKDAANFKSADIKSADIKSADIKSADIKSANGSLHTNSSRSAADHSSQLTAPFIKPVKTFCKVPCKATLQLFAIAKTWNSARSFCKGLGGDLASFTNTKDLKRAQKIVGAVPNIPSGYVWLGARCDGAKGECQRSEKKKTWKWVTGEVLPYSDPNWYLYPNGEPYSFDEPGCLVSYFAAYNCDHQFSFLCQF